MDSAQAWAHLESLYGEEVSMLSQTPQPSKTCIVFLQNRPSKSATITIDSWISENHLIWSLLASLADSNTPGFTTTFNRHYRTIWNDIQNMVDAATPAQRSLLYINPPPFERAVFVFTTPDLDKMVGFVIKSTLYNTRPHNDLLGLLDYLHHAQLSEDIKLYVALSEDGEHPSDISDVVADDRHDIARYPADGPKFPGLFGGLFGGHAKPSTPGMGMRSALFGPFEKKQTSPGPVTHDLFGAIEGRPTLPAGTYPRLFGDFSFPSSMAIRQETERWTLERLGLRLFGMFGGSPPVVGGLFGTL